MLEGADKFVYMKCNSWMPVTFCARIHFIPGNIY